MSKEILGKDLAKAQLDLFFDWYGIYTEEIENSLGDSSAAFALVLKTLTRAIQQGYIEIREDTVDSEPTLIVVQKFKLPVKHGKSSVTEITYGEVTGRTHIAIRPGKNVSDEARMYDFLSILCKKDTGFFCGIRAQDIRITRALGFLFLMV